MPTVKPKTPKTGKSPKNPEALKKQKTDPAPDLKAMERHIRYLHDAGPFTYQVFVKNVKAETGKTKIKKVSCSVKAHLKHVLRVRPNVIQRLAGFTAAGAEVAVVPNVMDGNGRRRENCIGVNWLFADCDAGHNTLESLLALPVPPSFIIETSPGHVHPYWHIKGCTVEQFSAAQDAIARKLGEDSSVSDPSRCMRLAGTLNHKRGKPVLARIVYPAAGKTVRKVHQLADFCAAMGLDLAEPAKAKEAGDKTSATKAMKEAGDNGTLSVEQVRKMLAQTDPSARDIWLKAGKALHSRWPDAEGYELWTTWSKRSQKFDADDQKRTWDTFKPGGGVTLGTLVHLAGGKARKWDERRFADAIVEAAVGKLGFDLKTRMWWRFTGVRWESSKGEHQALKFVRDYVDGLADEVDQEVIDQLGTVGRMNSAIKQAQLDDRIAIDEQQFDSDPYLLGVKNGVVDLRTGVFRAATAEDNLTRCCAVEFDPNAKCPEFRAFIRAICLNRKSLCLYLMHVLGYTVTGETKEQKFFVPMGEAGNGKGVLMNLMETILGNYATSVSPMLLMRANAGNPNAPAPAIMKLRGARMLLCTELQEGKAFDEAFIKQLTGGDTLTGREGYGQQTEFKVVGKLWVSSNHDPEVAYGAAAMWRRLRAMPFDGKFSDAASEDKDLRDKLLAEAPGILAVIVKFAKMYVEDGLPVCRHVDEATAALRGRLDSVKQWLDTHCREGEGEKLQSSVAHKDYVRFCKASKRPAVGAVAFKAALAEKGIQAGRRGPHNVFIGIRLIRA